MVFSRKQYVSGFFCVELEFCQKAVHKLAVQKFLVIVASGCQKTTKYENPLLNLSVIRHFLKSIIIKMIGSSFFCLQFEISSLY